MHAQLIGTHADDAKSRRRVSFSDVLGLPTTRISRVPVRLYTAGRTCSRQAPWVKPLARRRRRGGVETRSAWLRRHAPHFHDGERGKGVFPARMAPRRVQVVAVDRRDEQRVKPPCTCGHEEIAHQHYRRGTDCAFRDECGCLQYRSSEGLLRSLLTMVSRRA
jgi:hypothetical protein